MFGNNRHVQRIAFIISLIYFLLFLSVTPYYVYAQTTNAFSKKEGEATLGVARMIEVNEKDVKDGSIISASDRGAILSRLSYDPQIMGVVARDAAILLSNKNTPKGIPIISNGQVYVLVSSKNGEIKKGDLLTSSTMPGVAVKALKSGYVIGTALEGYSNTNPDRIEKIAADLDLHYFNSKPAFPGSLSDIFKVALLPTKDSPTPIFKYIVAAAVVISSIILGFLSFGRTAAKGVEALGRNPAASRIIHLGIIFNVSIVVIIVLAGLTVAFLILRL